MPLGEQPASCGKPFEIMPVGNVMSDPVQGDDDQPEHKGPGDVVVDPFAGHRNRGKPVFAEQRNKEIASVEGDQPGRAKDQNDPPNSQ